MATTNPKFTFKPGSVVDRVLTIQPGAHCRKTDRLGPRRYVVYIARRSRMEIGAGFSAHAAWTAALETLTKG